MSDHARNGKAAVISRYDVPSLKQRDLATVLEEGLRDWICKRPGFVSGAVLCSIDEQHIIAYTLWTREDDAVNYMQCAEGNRLLAMVNSSGARLRNSHVYSMGKTVATKDTA